MASYHLSVSIVSRAGGRSAVASAAYRACANIANERDGLVHDYTRKRGLLHEEVILPEHAPERFRDRAVLWNEVERVEKSQSAQLAREFVIAIPHELDEAGRIECARAFALSLAAEGMAADLCVHDADGDGHNVHAHVLCPMRAMDDDGFLAKSVNVYTVRDRDGREEKFTAAELKERKAEGWEKVYTFRNGTEKRLLTPSEAESWDGCSRVGKTPVQESRYLADWNNKEKVEEWRERWAGIQNDRLEKAGHDARVDHRSFERRGIEAVPQVHEGVRVRAMERKAERAAAMAGVEYAPVTDRRRENIARSALRARIERMVELRDALTAAIARKFDDGLSAAKEKLAAEIRQFRDRSARARSVLFQAHRAPDEAGQRALAAEYRRQEAARKREAARAQIERARRAEKERARSAVRARSRGRGHEMER